MFITAKTKTGTLVSILGQLGTDGTDVLAGQLLFVLDSLLLLALVESGRLPLSLLLELLHRYCVKWAKKVSQRPSQVCEGGKKGRQAMEQVEREKGNRYCLRHADIAPSRATRN